MSIHNPNPNPNPNPHRKNTMEISPITFKFEQAEDIELEDNEYVCNEHPQFTIQVCLYTKRKFVNESIMEDGRFVATRHHGEHRLLSDAKAQVAALVGGAS